MEKQNYNLIAISPFDFIEKGDGVRTRIAHITQDLKKNYKLLTFIRNEGRIYTNQDIKLGSKNKFLHLLAPQILYTIYTFKKHNPGISLYCHTIRAGLYGIVCKLLLGITYHFDDHNVEYLRFQRTKKRFRPFIKILEQQIIKFATSVSVVSEHDKIYIYDNLYRHKNIQVVENKVELNMKKIANKEIIKKNIRSQYHIADNINVLLFFGSFGYKPNIEALEIIENELVPNLISKEYNFQFIICGKGLQGKIDTPYIIYAGFVDDIVDYILAADVLVAPLISGSGTKLKIIEALGYGLTVITTDIGAEGIVSDKLIVSEIKSMRQYI